MDSCYEARIYGNEKGACQEDDCQKSPILSSSSSSSSSIREQRQEFYSSNSPCSYHIEDIQHISTEELEPIIPPHSMPTGTNTDAKTSVPELLLSYSPSPTKSTPDIRTTSFSYYDAWGNADEIPTRVPSAAALEEEEGGFPPLIRCRETPAMGRFPHDFVADIDDYDGDDDDDDDDYSVYDDSVVSEWSSFLTSIGNEAEVDSSERNMFYYCKDSVDIGMETKEVGSWSVVSRASSTTLPQRYTTTCSEGNSILIG